jgi:predicted neutral ceramidase superfamily lipid hydrolase
MEGVMEEVDRRLESKVRDIVAVATDDIDAVTVAVEDRVAYIEGVVGDEGKRRAIANTVRNVRGLRRVITCLVTEHVLPLNAVAGKRMDVPPPVLMHFHSLS